MSFYNAIASGYDQLYKKEQLVKLESIDTHIQFPKDASILDVGCGTGISTHFYAQKGFSIRGIDPSKQLLEQNKTGDLLELGCAEQLPYPNHSFEIVISISAIQNFSDIEKGLQEMKRVGNNTFVFSVMSRGENFLEIEDLLYTHFSIKKKWTVLNDTIFIAQNK